MIDFIVNKKMSFSLFAIVFLLFTSCKKEEIKPIEEAKENKTFVTKYFENPTGNKDDKALQLIISNIQDKYSIRVYGTFNDNNEPYKISTVTYQKENNDTLVNFSFNSVSQKLESVYFTVNGLNQPYVISYSYPSSSNQSIRMFVHNYDWSSESSDLIYDVLFEKTGGNVNPYINFLKKSKTADFAQSIGIGFTLAEALIWIGGGKGIIAGTAAGSALAAAAGTVIVVAAVGVIVVGALAYISSEAGAAEIELGDATSPNNSPFLDPVINPTQNLTPPSCNSSNINANVTMDQFGSILFSNPQGGSSFSYSFNNSNFQNSPVFNGPFNPGSYLIMIKNEQGCVRSELRNINEYVIDCSSLKINANHNGSTITCSASGGQSPYMYSLNNGASFTSDNTFTIGRDGDYKIIVKDANNCTDTTSILICNTTLTNVSIVANNSNYKYYINISYTSPLGLIPEFVGPNNWPLFVIDDSDVLSSNIDSYCDNNSGGSYPNTQLSTFSGDEYSATIKYDIPTSYTLGTETKYFRFRLPGQCFTNWSCPDNPSIKASQLYEFQWLK